MAHLVSVKVLVSEEPSALEARADALVEAWVVLAEAGSRVVRIGPHVDLRLPVELVRSLGEALLASLPAESGQEEARARRGA